MEIIDYLIKKEREYVSKFMDTSQMSNFEIDKMFDELVKKQYETKINQD